MNLVATTQKLCNAHCGGFFHSTLVNLEPEVKARNFAGAMWYCKQIPNLAEKCWCGRHREGARLVMARKALIRDSSTPKFLQRERRDAQSATKRYLKVTVLRTKMPSYPFFLAANHKVWREKSVWYKVSPLGKNQIANFLPKVAQNAGLQACGKKIANHSVRKTSITRLLDAGIPENYVTQLSGHKNLQSLSSYKSASLTHQRQMSDTLQHQLLFLPSSSTVHTPVVHGNGQGSFQWFSNESSSSFSLQAMPHSSFFPSASMGSISDCVFNLVQAPSDPGSHPADSVHENAAKCQKLDDSS